MQGLPVGRGKFAGRRMDNKRGEALLKGFVIKIKGIGQERLAAVGQAAVARLSVASTAFADTAGSGYITPALVARPAKAKYPWWHPALLVLNKGRQDAG